MNITVFIVTVAHYVLLHPFFLGMHFEWSVRRDGSIMRTVVRVYRDDKIFAVNRSYSDAEVEAISTLTATEFADREVQAIVRLLSEKMR